MGTATADTRQGIGSVVMGTCAMVLLGSSVSVSHTLIHAPLLVVQALRYAAAIPVLAVLARTAGARVVRPRGSEWPWLAGVAAVGLVLFNVAVVRGVAHAEPAAIAVAVACVPILLGVVGPLLERRRPRRRLLLAAVVVTAGSVLVEGVGRTDTPGVVWAVVALASEAGFTLLAMPVLPRHGAWGVSLHSVWMATLMLTALSVPVEGVTALTRIGAADWAAIGYLAVMVTAVTFVLWYSTVSFLGAGRAGLLTGISPVSAAATSVVMGNQAPQPLVWIGMLVVISGLGYGLRRTADTGTPAGGGRDAADRLPPPGRRGAPGRARYRGSDG